MIGWEDVYKVAAAMAPLYVALILGYGSVRWWHMFTPEQCDAINRLVSYFTLPLFAFEFTSTVNPFEMNYPFIAADVVSKCIIVVAIGFWAKFSTSSNSRGSWSITSFCLATLSNTLVVGLPLMKGMLYGQMGVDLVVQASVVQSLLWFPLLLFVLEFRHSWNHHNNFSAAGNAITHTIKDSHVLDQGKDLEGNNDDDNNNNNALEISKAPAGRPLSLWPLMNVVLRKLAMNPNCYACVLGITWALFSKKCHIEMPSIVDESILILAKAGTGTAMFSMGLFTATQERIIACGAGPTAFGMVLRFIAGPAAMAIGSLAVGLRGNVLRVAIIQAAMPQSITSFIFAKQYGLHADVISTAVIFGTLVSLPVLIAYYAALESLP